MSLALTPASGPAQRLITASSPMARLSLLPLGVGDGDRPFARHDFTMSTLCIAGVAIAGLEAEALEPRVR